MWLPLLAALAWGDEPDRAVRLPLTVLDAPHDLRGEVPTMRQSLDATYSVYRLWHHGVWIGAGALFPERDGWRYASGLALAYGSMVPLTFVGAWLHEEWHRSVLRSWDIQSRNGVFFPSSWSGPGIPVDQVSDPDLVALHDASKPDAVRLAAAGFESAGALRDRVFDEAFFHGDGGRRWGPAYVSHTFMAVPAQVGWLQDLLYLTWCGSRTGDAKTDAENRRVLTAEDRSATGLDCTAWVYDLHRPDAAYADRGPHPYGEGVDRFVSREDLTPEERSTVRAATVLHFVDLLNPQMWFLDGFGTERSRWVASASYWMAPFGHAIDLRLGVHNDDLLVRADLLLYRNDTLLAPGARLTLLDRQVGGAPVRLTSRIDLWLQPERLQWDDKGLRPGGLFSVTAAWRARPWLDVTVEGLGKSDGWVPGLVDLDPAVHARMGVVWRLPR